MSGPATLLRTTHSSRGATALPTAALRVDWGSGLTLDSADDSPLLPCGGLGAGKGPRQTL
jgi:hypothetical protein